MIRLGGFRCLKWAIICGVVLFAGGLSLAEAVACGPDNDACPLMVCCTPALITSPEIRHVEASSFWGCPPILLPHPLFALSIFHPPRS